MSRREEIRQLITNYQRRLQKLKEQQALYGSNVDPAILIQVEDIEAELEKLKVELAELEEIYRLAPSTSPPLLPPAPSLIPLSVAAPRRDRSYYGALIGGGIAILLLLLGGAWFFTSNGREPTSLPSTRAAIIPQGTPSPVLTLTPTPSPTPTGPWFGQIVFAQGADPATVEPINPADCFPEGTTEVHAVFEYGGMVNGQHWEWVWYRDEIEALHKSSQWSYGEHSFFDRFIETGGHPLLPGDWRLELYVDGKLMQEGSFKIDRGC